MGFLDLFTKKVLVCCCGSENPGSNKLQCENCKGIFCWGILYFVTCPHCGYQPEKDCETCQGSGISTCEVCHGKGYVNHEDYAENHECTFCRGVKETTCMNCDGTGHPQIYGKK